MFQTIKSTNFRRLFERSATSAQRLPPETVGRRAFLFIFVAHKKGLSPARQAGSAIKPTDKIKKENKQKGR
jgi:hypothetical protein